MSYSPARLPEILAQVLVPPAIAEHVLGDLEECSRSDAGYVRNLASILPRVVWSQIRRRATIGGARQLDGELQKVDALEGQL